MPQNSLQVQNVDPSNRIGAIGLFGMAGSGKTTGALLLAHGMMAERYPDLMSQVPKDEDGRYQDFSPVSHLIGVIDTEHRSNMSANRIFKVNDYIFKIGYFRVVIPPVGQAILADWIIGAKNMLRDSGCQVVIIDSLSHMWEELLSVKNSLVSSGKFNNFNAEAAITPFYQKLIREVIQTQDVEIIATLRGKTDWNMEQQNSGGKSANVPKATGHKAHMKSDITYEFQVLMEIIQENHAIKITKDNTRLFEEGEVITPNHGAYLERWLKNKINDHQVMLWKLSMLAKQNPVLMQNIYQSYCMEKKWYQVSPQQANGAQVMKTSYPSPMELNEFQLMQVYEYIRFNFAQGMGISNPQSQVTQK